MTKILLLTFKDCDNVGDQIIEACSDRLLRLVLNDLGISDYIIDSLDIGTVSTDRIKEYQMIVFGGGGIIKYRYQNFYKYISTILSVANRENVPVIFSSVGVEGYDFKDYRCRLLQEALNRPCVKQITTRDDLDSLNLYIKNPNVVTAFSADPAVYSSYVFGPSQSSPNKTIGLAVVRDGIFKANGLKWGKAEELEFWSNTIALLEKKGYDFRVFTTGHFGDEVFAINLMEKCGFDSDKVIWTVNSREKLIDEMQQMSGIIAFRLHAGIISYALNIPAVNLSWNNKVALFYKNVGLSERALEFTEWNAKIAVKRLEEALSNHRERDKNFSYMYSTYSTLFDGVFTCLFSNQIVSQLAVEKKRCIEEIILDEKLYAPPRNSAEMIIQANNKIIDIENRYAKLELKMSKIKPSVFSRIVGKLRQHGDNRLVIFIKRIYHFFR